jgi:hypothetical protein
MEMTNEIKINGKEIVIISGEGENGTAEKYTGKKTQRAIRARLTCERCGGDRWAKAVQYEHECADGTHAGRDLEKDELVGWYW